MIMYFVIQYKKIIRNCFYMMCLNIEREILLEIKQKLGFNLNWNTNIELSQWNRIKIHDNNSKFKVKNLNLYNLNLYNLNLIGKIPTEIGQLVNLQSLSLHYNKLIGKIPTEIGQLFNLNNLSLDNNQLTGKIPTEIGQLVNLNFL
jgi:Leucine-rich repeat (LRR) protein